MPSNKRRRQKAQKQSKPPSPSPPTQPPANPATAHPPAAPPTSQPPARRPLGPGDPITLTSSQFAHLLITQGQPQRALQVLQQTIQDLQHLSDEDPHMIDTISALAMTHSHCGHHDKALEYHFRALPAQEKVFGEMHRDTANTLAGIAAAYSHFSRYDKTLEYFMRALAVREAVLGETDPVTWETAENVGRACDAAGRPGEAKRFYEKAEEGRRKHYEMVLNSPALRELTRITDAELGSGYRG